MRREVLPVALFLVAIGARGQVSGGSLGTQPTSCAQAVYFSDCLNKLALRINGCELLSQEPGKYYACQCTHYKALELCYAHCADDPKLQLEKLTRQTDTVARCKLSSDFNSTVSTTTTTIPSTSVTTRSRTLVTLPVHATTATQPVTPTSTPTADVVVLSSGSSLFALRELLSYLALLTVLRTLI